MNLQSIFAPNGTRMTVNGRYANEFGGLLDDLTAAGYGPKQEQSGGYNPRNIAGTNTPSHHASGRAIDVNWNDNPRGGQGAINPQMARDLAQKHGMTWGGDWKNPDPMHFEVSGKATVLPKLELLDIETGANARTWKAAPMDYQWNDALPLEEDEWRRKQHGQSLMGDGAGAGSMMSWQDQLRERFTGNPVFMSGLTGFMRSARGDSGGHDEGVKIASGVQEAYMRQLALQKKAQQQARIREMMSNPDIMKDVPPALIEIARATGSPEPVQNFLLAQAKAKALRKEEGDPSNIREWNQFQQMTPDKQRQYLTMKRADKWLDTESGFVKPDALRPGQVDGSQINKDFAGKELDVAKGKFLAAQPKLEMNLQALDSQTNMAKQEIASAIEDIRGGGVTSWAGIYAPYAPGTTAFALSRRLLTLKALVGLDKLGEMRDSSATGASGLGALSEKEMELLTSVFGSLDQRQDAATLERNLRRVDELMGGRVARMREAYGKDLARFGMFRPPMAPKRLKLNPQTGELE